MKNLHVLPTSQPSRLIIQNSNKLILGQEAYSIIENRQNIYITNSEEIKDGTWGIQKSTGKFMFLAFNRSESYNKNKDSRELFTKIILTTDQDLIKKGVQAIDDEFLEWFCSKNGEVDFVEVITVEDEKN